MNGKSDKVIVINFVAKHSYIFVINMVKGLVENGCKAVAIISKNMPEIEQWRRIKGLKLIEIDGYTSLSDFIPKLLRYYCKDVPRIKRIVKKYDDVVMYIPMLSYWSYFVKKSLNQLDYVFDMHDPISHSKKHILLIFFNYQLGLKAKKIRILSETFREHVKKKYKKTDRQIVVIPSGCENVKKNSNVEIVRYEDDKLNFLFQGRIDEYKGLEILAKAYKRLSLEYQSVTLTIAGSGDITPYSKELTDLPRCTVINRWITDEEVASLFNDRNVVAILPYKTATQSGVINVAMPCGTPVIASACGAIPEQIQDGKTGYLVKPGDIDELYIKMKYVLNNQDELKVIRTNGYERMESLDWKILSKKLMLEF